MQDRTRNKVSFVDCLLLLVSFVVLIYLLVQSAHLPTQQPLAPTKPLGCGGGDVQALLILSRCPGRGRRNDQ